MIGIQVILKLGVLRHEGHEGEPGGGDVHREEGAEVAAARLADHRPVEQQTKEDSDV